MCCWLRRLACGLCLAGLGALGVVALHLVASTQWSGTDSRGMALGDVLVLAAAGAAGIALLLLALSGSVTVLTAVKGHVPVAVGPLWWRRLVLAGCGLGLSAVPLGTAVAAPASPPDVGCRPPCTAGLDGLPLPELPAARDPIVTLVRAGDSLWQIARAHLPAHASDTEVADLTRRLHAANRAAIGSDPDLIFPGTYLTVPGGTP